MTQSKRLAVISSRSLRDHWNNLSLQAKVSRKRRSRERRLMLERHRKASQERLTDWMGAQKFEVLSGTALMRSACPGPTIADAMAMATQRRPPPIPFDPEAPMMELVPSTASVPPELLGRKALIVVSTPM